MNRRIAGAIMLAWLAVVFASLAWSWLEVGESVLELARMEAASHFEKDLLFRRWVAMHGGVYVPPTAETPPNPYLAKIEERDVVTTTGKALTLINPAYMTRQVHELAAARYGVQGHITSLKPLRPENAPDDWERQMLTAFEQGVREGEALETKEGVTYFRFMRPLLTEAPCLKCHEQQGYKVGDVRGGISIAVPYAPFAKSSEKHRLALMLGHGAIGLLGLIGLWAGTRRLQRTEDVLRQSLAEAKRMAEQEALLLASLGEGVYGVDPSGRCVFINPAALAMLGLDADEVIGQDQHQVFHSRREDGTPYPREECPIHRTLCDGENRRVVDAFIDKDGRHFPVSLTVTAMRHDGAIVGAIAIFHDISERIRAERERQESEGRMRALFEASSETTLLLDPSGKILAINAIGARRFGRTPTEMIGGDFFAFLPPALAAARRLTLQQAVAAGEPLHSQDSRGAIRFENSLYPVKNKAGIVESIAIYAKDVTEQLRNEQTDAIFHRLDLMLLKWRMDLTAIAQMFCEEILPLYDLAAAWIGRTENDGRLVLVASAVRPGNPGFHDYLRETHLRWDTDLSGCMPIGAAIRDGNAQKVALDDAACPSWGEVGRRAGAGAALILPLTLGGKAWGVLALYAVERELFDRPDIPPRLGTITGRLCVSLESALQQEWQELLDVALNTTSNAVFITDDAARILWANRAFNRLSGYVTEELLGKTPRMFASGIHDAEFYGHFWQTIKSGETWRGEVVNARRDGSRYTVDQTVTPLRDANNRVSHYVSVVEDISERKAAAVRIEHMANYDLLTDLPNRGLFLDRLGQALALAKRGGEGGAVLFLDLDRFKQVNDQLGHEAGDLLLKAVAVRLRREVRESDTLARLGGDEFTVLLPHVGALHDAEVVAGKIIAAIAEPFDLNGNVAAIGVSVGIALFPLHGQDVELILNAADQSMYAAKQAGRNTFRVYAGS